MFIDLTFSVMDNPLIKALNAVCSAGIMVIMLVSFAMKSAAEDMKQERMSGGNTRRYAVQSACGIAAVPAASWITLLITKGTGVDFYRWHKVLNAAFLRVYNCIEKSAASAQLDTAELLLMLPLAIVPPAAYTVTYILVRKGIVSAE